MCACSGHTEPTGCHRTTRADIRSHLYGGPQGWNPHSFGPHRTTVWVLNPSRLSSSGSNRGVGLSAVVPCSPPLRISTQGRGVYKPIEKITVRHAVARLACGDNPRHHTVGNRRVQVECCVAGERPVIPRGVRSVGPDESHASGYWGPQTFQPSRIEQWSGDVHHGKHDREDEHSDCHENNKHPRSTHSRPVSGHIVSVLQ